MIIAEHISIILTVTGAVTALVVLQFFFPAKILQLLSKVTITDEAGLFYARHWGLLAFSIGALLIYAADHAEARAPIMLFAAIEKAGLVAIVVLHAKRPYTKGMRLAAVFDGACVLIYAAYLLGID
ncbi:MAG TPA: hypothetical protein VIF60_11925 [Burkholderiaceae bacterium]|jgi:hypothetical protein